MPSQKLENILNLSLESTQSQRQRSDVLKVGYDASDSTWELIVKYSGDLSAVPIPGMTVEPLLAGYAIVTIPQSQIPALTAAPETEYVEMPKNLQNGLYEAKRVSCILPLTGSGAAEQTERGSRPGAAAPLSGQGTLVAVLDSGIDYYLPDFRNPDGSTRIAYLWDQTLEPERLAGSAGSSAAPEGSAAAPEGFSTAPEGSAAAPEGSAAAPEGFAIGVEFSRQQIDEALRAGSRDAAFTRIPSLDRSGHGTAVAAIAAGSNPSPALRGVASGADLLIVKLANLQSGFPRTTELMRGVTWALQKARQLKMPLSVNISFGNTYGPHDGSSLLSRFLDNAAESGRTVICVGSGNEGASSGHASGRLSPGEPQTRELAVAEYERTLSIQLWKNFADSFQITLITPSGREIPVLSDQIGRQDILTPQTEILIYSGQPSPYSVQQEIFFDLLPTKDYIEPGIWRIRLVPEKIVSGEYQLYLPVSEVRTAGTRFVRPALPLTLTVPSTAAKVITVGASNAAYQAYADFSGRGAPLFLENETVFVNSKPDLVAPGVNLSVPAAGGGTQQVTGTSFSSPLVSGTAALLMEWGIVRGNDPYLYGEKMKACLRRGARALRGEAVYPNEKTGYGQLCAADSLFT